MKLEQVLNENPDKLRKTLDAVRRECSDYLKEVARSGVFIYRGSKTRKYEGFYRTYPKGDRPSRDTTPLMDKLFHRIIGGKYPGYERVRQSSAFGFPDGLDRVWSYGHPYAMFPQNGSEYVSLKGVDDYTVLMGNYIRDEIIILSHNMEDEVTDSHMMLIDDISALSNSEMNSYRKILHNPDDYSIDAYEEAIKEIGRMLYHFFDRYVSEKIDVPDSLVDSVMENTDISERFDPELIVSDSYLDVARNLDHQEEILVTGDNGYYMVSWHTLKEHFGIHERDNRSHKIAQKILDGEY